VNAILAAVLLIASSPDDLGLAQQQLRALLNDACAAPTAELVDVCRDYRGLLAESAE